jgi:hypothetical protein
MERGWASAVFRLPEEKEETHMPDFDVGNPVLQGLLEWVDQPPPPQGRDTHAIIFELQERTPDLTRPTSLHYGLMFFRPGNPTAFFFRDQPGLSGTGGLTDQAVTPNVPFWVQVEVRFRPPRVNSALFFFRGGTLPEVQERAVEMSAVSVVGDGSSIRMDSGQESWILRLHKTTVLLRRP